MKYFILVITGLFMFASSQAQDLPFIVTPTAGTTLPSALIPGQTANAYYTISNNTPITTPITGNFIKYFPPNVTQALTDLTYTDICQTTFTLQPKGSAGDSCTLKLQISNPVVTLCGSDNPHGCLFICMSDRTTCGGTLYPLHVTQAVSVAVGNSTDALGNALPFTYISTNGGLDWTLSPVSISGAPPNQTQGALNGVVCSGATCSTIGYTYDPSFNYFPLSYTSRDNGLTWLASPNVTLPDTPAGYTSALFNQLSCHDSSCVVVGNLYFQNFTSPSEPLGYSSVDFGINWDLSNPFPQPSPPAAQKTLWGVSCNGNACTTVGQINNLGTTAGTPLGYYSSDGGINWNLSSSFTIPSTQGILFSTQCQGSHCVAAGLSYTTSFGLYTFTDPLPLVYTSEDNGQSWSTPQSLTPPGGKTYGLLWGITCVDATCVAVGQAYNNDALDSIPIAYTSTNGGLNWVAASGLTLPAGQTQGLLYTVSCTNSYCIAVGKTYNVLFSDTLPIVYYSQNSGVTWTRSPALTLPTAATGGALIGVSSGT